MAECDVFRLEDEQEPGGFRYLLVEPFLDGKYLKVRGWSEWSSYKIVSFFLMRDMYWGQREDEVSKQTASHGIFWDMALVLTDSCSCFARRGWGGERGVSGLRLLFAIIS